MDTQQPAPGESGSLNARLAGATSNTEILVTQHEHRHKLVHLDAAYVAPKSMSKDAHLKIVRKTRSRKNKKEHAVECECNHIQAIGGQVTVKGTAGVRGELCNKFIAAHHGKPPWFAKAIL